MRLLLDEMFDPEVAVQLRRRGHDVVAVKERRGWHSAKDPELLSIAQAEGRVVVTENVDDFLDLDHGWRQVGKTHRGIVLTHSHHFHRRGSGGVGQLVLALDRFLQGAAGESFEPSFVRWLQ